MLVLALARRLHYEEPLPAISVEMSDSVVHNPFCQACIASGIVEDIQATTA